MRVERRDPHALFALRANDGKIGIGMDGLGDAESYAPELVVLFDIEAEAKRWLEDMPEAWRDFLHIVSVISNRLFTISGHGD